VAAEESLIRARQEALRRECEQKKTELWHLGGVCLMPREYNELVHEFGNKSTVLSLSSLLLVKELLAQVPTRQNISVMCDKHGGRNRYRSLIEIAFDVKQVEIEAESPQQSRYRFRFGDSDIQISFSVQGESQLPVALASMFAKYTREIFMMAWNQYWHQQIAGIEPTQGYPVDAARFLKQIQTHLSRLNIELNSIWRER
jgi:ribonuclease HIII